MIDTPLLSEDALKKLSENTPTVEYLKFIQLVKDTIREQIPSLTEKDLLLASCAVLASASNYIAFEATKKYGIELGCRVVYANQMTANKTLAILETIEAKAKAELYDEQGEDEDKPFDEGEDFRS